MGQKPDPKSKKPSPSAGSKLPSVRDLSKGDWKEVPKKPEPAWDEKITDPLPKPFVDDGLAPEDVPTDPKGATAGDDSATADILEISEIVELTELSSSFTQSDGYPQGGRDPSSVILAIDGWLQNKEAIRRLIPETNQASAKARRTDADSEPTGDSALPLKGRSLERALDGCRTAKQRMALLPRFIQVCRTLAYAHSRGVVHLGLDEKSIVLGERGETVIRNWDSAAVLERGGALPAPPSSPIGLHMSPERVGNAAPPHRTADIWSLGVLLYRILTGRPLFEASDSEALRSLILDGEIIHPRQIEPRIPDSLAKLCLRALRRSPRKRLNDAATLGRLLERNAAARVLYSPKDITKVPVPTGQKKTNTPAIAAAVILIALAASLMILFNPFRVEPPADKTAAHQAAAYQAKQKAMKEAQQEALRLLQASLKASLTLAKQAEQSAAKHRHHAATIHAAASLLGNPAYPGSPNFDENFAANNSQAGESAASMLGRHYLSRAWARYEILDTTDSGSDIAVWTMHPHAEAVFVGTDGGVVRRHDMGTWSTPEELGNLSSAIVALQVSSDGDTLIAVSQGGEAWIWDTRTGQRKARLSVGGKPIVAASLSFDGSVLATSHQKGDVKLWGTQRGKPLSDLRSSTGAAQALAYNPQRNRLAVGGSGGEIMIWQLPAERRHLLIEAHSKPVQSLAYSADGSRLLSTSDDGTVRIWDTEKGRRLFSIKLGFTEVPVATWVPNNESWLAVVSEGGSLRILDWKNDLILLQLDPLSGPVQLVAHSADSGFVLTKSPDGEVGIWRRSEHSIRHVFVSSNESDVVNDVAFSKDGTVMAAAASNHAVRVWKNAKQASEIAFATKGEPAVQTAVSPDGHRVAALTESGTLRTWLLDPTELSFMTKSQSRRDRGLAFVPGKEQVAVGGADGSVRFLAADSGELIRSSAPNKKNGVILDLAFSPDGKMAASLHKNGRLVLRDPLTGEEITTCETDAALTTLGGFSKDGRRIAACAGKSLLLFDTKNAQLAGTIAWNDVACTDAAYAADGPFIAASGKKHIGIWDSETLTPVLDLKLSDPVSTIAPNPNGGHLVFAVKNRIAMLPLELTPDKADAQALLSRAEQAAGFTLEDLTAHMID